MKDVPKRKDVSESAFKKKPEEDHSSIFYELDYDYEMVTLSQQQVAKEFSKVLESGSEASEEEKPLPKKRRPAIKCMYHHHKYSIYIYIEPVSGVTPQVKVRTKVMIL
jgi:hypothetical protein